MAAKTIVVRIKPEEKELLDKIKNSDIQIEYFSGFIISGLRGELELEKIGFKLNSVWKNKIENTIELFRK